MQLFRKHILSGQYSLLFAKPEEGNGQAEVSIFDKVTQQVPKNKKQTIMYYIYEQQYIELMMDGKNLEAIQLLRRELVPRSPYGKDKINLFKLA